MTTGDWFFTLLLLSIPLVNFILFIVWACGVGNRNRVAYCRATLIWAVLAFVLYFMLFSVLGIATGFSHHP